MRLIPIYFAAVVGLLFTSCKNDKQTTTAVSFDSTATIDSVIINKPVAQTDTAVYTDKMPAQTVGAMILDGTLKPGDNAYTFRMMDSLLSAGNNSRQFYFTVFDNILDHADGALGEAIGDYALQYVQQNPAEFIAYSKDFTNERMDTWATQIGIEIYLSDNDSKIGYNHFAKLLTSNCKGCDKATTLRLQNFTKQVWQTIEQNKKAYNAGE